MSAMGVGRAMQLVWLGEAYLLEGRLDDARERAQEAVSLARRHQERGHEAWSLRLLGDIASHRDPPSVETAEGYYREALALAGELGMRPLVAHCHFHLGKLFLKADQRGARPRASDASDDDVPRDGHARLGGPGGGGDAAVGMSVG